MELDEDLHKAILRAAGDYFMKTFTFTQSIKLTTTLTVVVDCDRHYQYTAFDEIKSGDTWFNGKEDVHKEQVIKITFDHGEDDPEDTVDYTEADTMFVDEENTERPENLIGRATDVDYTIKHSLPKPDTNQTKKSWLDNEYNAGKENIIIGSIDPNDTDKPTATRAKTKHTKNTDKILFDEGQENSGDSSPDIYDSTERPLRRSKTKTTREKHKKTYKCPICFKQISNRTVLLRHIKTDHKDTCNSNFKCLLCDEDCVNLENFVKHWTKKHVLKEIKETLPTVLQQDLDDSPCEKSVKTKSKKELHKTTHKKKRGLKNYGNVNRDCVSEVKNDNEIGLAVKKVNSLKIKIKKCESSSGRFECKTCGANYQSMKSLNRHKIEHKQTIDRFQCDKCEKSFKRLETLQSHQRAIHTDGKLFKCTEEGCEASFNFHHSLKLHKLKHTGARPYKCSQCNKTYLTAYHLKVHENGAHTEVKGFTCKICGKSFRYSNSLKVHEATHGVKVREKCDQCEKTFVNKNALRYHKMARHGETGQFECDICKKIYKSELLLKSHRKRHTKDIGRFMCDLCGRQYMYQSALEMHKSVHRDEKNFKCKLCDKAFKTRPTLYSHMFVHKKDSPFVCGTCNKAFKTKERLKAHCKRHAGLKPFECQLCKHRFPDKGGLTKHTKTVHCPQKKFTCDICGKTTTRADNLRVHMKIHAKGNVKPTMTVEDSSAMDSDNLPYTVPLVIDTGEEINVKPGRKQRKPRASAKPQAVPSVAMQDIAPENNESTNPPSYQQNMPHFSTIDSSQISSSLQTIPKKFQNNSTESRMNGIPSHIANENLIVINTDNTEAEEDSSEPTSRSVVSMVPSTVTAGTISVTPMQPVSYLYPWSYIYTTGTQQPGNTQGLYQQ